MCLHFAFSPGCPYRRYGEQCEHVCSEHCLGQGQCDLVSGSCWSGCLDGWVGKTCDLGIKYVCHLDIFFGRTVYTFYKCL